MRVKLIKQIRELRDQLANVRRKVTIGCVPTMGALHAGHGALIDRARRECDFVVATVFVNPIQFNQARDFEGYPRTLKTDLEFCETRGVDIVFAPDQEEIYPEPTDTYVEVERLSEHLCGAHRPGHFRGVTTVVMKLFNIMQPNRAYFGEKDAQQLAVIRRMVRDLNIPITIVGVPIVREADGLAVSSRNRHLSAGEREAATVLFRALEAARVKIEEGEGDAGAVQEAVVEILRTRPEVRVEYVEVVDEEEMQPVAEVTGPVRIATAAWLGETRLIDNVGAAPTGG